MRTRHESRGSVPCMKLINHHNEADQWPALFVSFDVHVKRLCWCARFQGSREHGAELEWPPDNSATGRKQWGVDVKPIELRASVDEVVDSCRGPNRDIRWISR